MDTTTHIQGRTSRKAGTRHFIRHYVEMVIAMFAGMTAPCTGTGD